MQQLAARARMLSWTEDRPRGQCRDQLHLCCSMPTVRRRMPGRLYRFSVHRNSIRVQVRIIRSQDTVPEQEREQTMRSFARFTVSTIGLILLGSSASCYRPETKAVVHPTASSNSVANDFSFLGTAVELQATIERQRTVSIGNPTFEEISAAVKAGTPLPSTHAA
jgi:hypothetical protein